MWTALLGVLILGAAGDQFMLTICPHGLQFLPPPVYGVIGFGRPTLLGGLVIWGFALAYSCRRVFARSFRTDVRHFAPPALRSRRPA